MGFPAAIAVTYAGTLLLRAADQGPAELADHPATLFISSPDLFSVIVAVLAGVAGVLSLSTAKSGALIGVLISVTTIPAAANVGVAAAYRDWLEFGGAAFQLGLNLIVIVVSGVATLGVQRALHPPASHEAVTVDGLRDLRPQRGHVVLERRCVTNALVLGDQGLAPATV